MNKSLIILLASLIFVSACGDSGTIAQTNPAGLTPPPAAPITSITLAGLRSDYSIIKTASGYFVTDKTGVSQSIAPIGQIIFSDMQINLGIGDKSQTILPANLQTLIELYIAYFNRVPDADGLSYWIDQVKAGQSIDQIGQSFYSAAIQYSSLTGYSATMTNTDFVKIIYKNVLGRDTVDQEGLDYWTKSLASGAATRGTLIHTILGSAHGFKGDASYGWVADLLDNKVKLANLFTIQQGIKYITDEDSISKTMALAAAIKPNNTANAVNLIGKVDWGFREVPNPRFSSAPIPVEASSYENKLVGGQADVPVQANGQNGQWGFSYFHAFANADFFQDGSMSLVTHSVTYTTDKPASLATSGLIQFWKKENGKFVDYTSKLITDNSGCINVRKAIVADFNNDGKPDVFFACHGYDVNPFNGEKQIVLLSNPDGTYTKNVIGDNCFCHGATAADINGDGNVDIVVADALIASTPYVLINDGNGHFTKNTSTLPVTLKYRPIFAVELLPAMNGKYDLWIGGNGIRANMSDFDKANAVEPTIIKNVNGTYSNNPADWFVMTGININTPNSQDIVIEGAYAYIARDGYDNTKTNYFDGSTAVIQRVNLNTKETSVAFLNTGKPFPDNSSTWIDWLTIVNGRVTAVNSMYGFSVL